MSLAVIGAGLGRTGTHSLKLALERLGFGPCYHMFEVLAHPEHDAVWHAATRGEPVDWDALFQGYGSAVDWPVAGFWRELADHYPESRFILTARDPGKWHASVMETIYRALTSDPDSSDPARLAHRAMTRELIIDRTFGGKLDDRDHAVGVYERHNQAVRGSLAPDRLLEFDPGDGWDPLCRFLDRPVPNVPYPHSNTRKDFVSRLREKDAGKKEQR